MVTSKMFSSGVDRDKVAPIAVEIDEEGNVHCDVLTLLFGMGQGSRTATAYIPHSSDQATYDLFEEAINTGAQEFADKEFKGSWQVWEVEQGKISREVIEATFSRNVIPQSDLSELAPPSQT